MRFIVLLFLATLLGCGEGREPEVVLPTIEVTKEQKPAEPAEPSLRPQRPISVWDRANSTATRDGLLIEVAWAKPLTVTGTKFGEWRDFGTCLVVKLRVTNTHATLIKTLKGWQAIASASDEHGNRYAALNFGTGFDGFSDDFSRTHEDREFIRGSDTSAILAYNLRLHPGKSYITHLFFEQPADVSKELRLRIPREHKDEDDVHFRLPITSPAPSKIAPRTKEPPPVPVVEKPKPPEPKPEPKPPEPKPEPNPPEPKPEPNPPEPKPKEVKITLSASQPVNKGVVAWIELDGKRLRAWEPGLRSIEIFIPEGKHKIAVLTMANQKPLKIMERDVNVKVGDTLTLDVGKK
jgi:hypothetical protein